MNLLGQNPSHHVTPTSGLIHLMRQVMDRWTTHKEFRAQGLENAKPFVNSALRGMLYGFYEQQFDAGKTVFDKSRGWLQFIEPLESILGRRVKIVTMVRDVRSIVASFEKIFRARGIEYRQPGGDAGLATLSLEGRVRRTISPQRVTGRSLLRLRDALDRCPDRLLVVPYRRLTESPQHTMTAIHEALRLPHFSYDPNHVKQVTHEDDGFNGMELHKIRPKVEAPPEQPWKGLLPDDFSAEIAEQYADINALAAGDVVDYDNV
jgi:hypothetical protein